ncbi:hypothetical protein GCM10009775_18650 [Microbacterium aoyamense]|uniref:Uncharacterized protein n=1 Tax=Microbacterium aoyamense TaxID=344166 RepID=A0ABP5B1Q4_9MICO|nr:DUF6541 family protein [Microbacterium aoyamense]
MLSWLTESVALAGAVLVVFGPGVLVGCALRLRGLALWAIAPAIGAAVLTGSSLVLGLFGVGWTPLSAAISLVVVALIVWGVRHLLGLGPAPAARTDRRARLLLSAGIAIGIVLVALRVGLYIGDAGAISQTNDGAFHLNALRFAVETGWASPLRLNGVVSQSGFYPSAWHVLASLVVQLTGTSVEVAANVVTLVLSAGAWTLGIAYLTRVVAGPVAASIAAALAASISAFPLLLVQWGVLYPQLLATAVLPAAIAVVADARRLIGSEDAGARWARSLRLGVVAALAVGAILAAQPSVALAWALAALSIGAWALVARWSRLTRRLRILALGGLGVGLFLTAGVWALFSASTSVTWPPSTRLLTAGVEVVMNGFLGYPWAVLTSILMIIGIVVAVRMPRLRGIATTWIVLVVLYGVAAAIGDPRLRAVLVGPWYEDPYRLAALIPVVALPLAGAGAAAIVARASVVWGRRGEDVDAGATRAATWTALGVVAAIGVISLVVAPQIARRDVFAHRVDPNLYAVTADSFLSADELAVLRRLAETVPEDAAVIGNPSTGMAFGYALSGRNVIPHSWAPPGGPDYPILWESLRDVATNPEVCPALDAFGARYVLDFGPGEQYPGRWIMPGFTDIDGQPGFELVDREGDAMLWRVTACD